MPAKAHTDCRCVWREFERFCIRNEFKKAVLQGFEGGFETKLVTGFKRVVGQ